MLAPYPWSYTLSGLLAVLALLVPVPRGLAGAAADEDTWKFDVVRLKSGRVYQGLVVEDKPDEIKFRTVVRKPGAATSILPTTFRRDEIDKVELLSTREREALARRLETLVESEKIQSKQQSNVKLTSVAWGKDGKEKALQYESKYFVLKSDADEDLVRRAAVRLDQAYAAYLRALPPHLKPSARTTVLLCKSEEEYKVLAAQRGLDSLHPAFFHPRTNEVLCWDTEFRERIKARLSKEEREKVAAEMGEVRSFLGRVQHEAFHAYLENFVYNSKDCRVPLWLNEGLAQIFEAAIVEAGEFRVGHFSEDQFRSLKKRQRDGTLVPVVELLQADERFAAVHTSDRSTSNRHYETSLGLAHYVVYNRKLLGTDALDQYVKNLAKGMGPTEAFRKLVAQPLPEFEDQFLDYIRDLRPDGTVEK